MTTPRLFASTLAACAAAIAIAAPIESEAYLGLTVRDVPDVGCVVAWVDPGPLEGVGLGSPTVARPDLLLSIDGRPASVESLRARVASAKPGERITLAYRRASRRGPAFPSSVDHDAEVRTLEIELAPRGPWIGTWREPPLPTMRADDAPQPMLLAPTGPGPFAQALAETGSSGALDSVVASLRAVAERNPDRRRLRRIGQALESPLALPELAAAVAEPLLLAERPYAMATKFVADNLDAVVEGGAAHGSIPVFDIRGGLFALDFLLNQSRLSMQAALGERFGDDDFARSALATALHLRESLLIAGPDSERMLAVVRAGAEFDADALVAAVAHLDAEIGFREGWSDGEPDDVPEDLRGAVTGSILTAERIEGIGWAVVGGYGPNEYDMSVVAAVLDPGGEDRYRMSSIATGMRCVIDVAGNDRYEGSAEQGFAAGVCGLFLVDDYAGDDVYLGGALNAGAGLFGVGLLIDRAGNDRYQGGAWSQGAACWGAGLLVDLGGDDLYVADYLSQGCGGPRGLGALIDRAGNDRYDAIGSRASHYGTPAVAASFSQGIGVGIRRFAAGGIGLLADLDGDDRYEAGEFAQGGGYFLGLGVLFDGGGSDRYWGNRYGQGFAAHQAAGALIDESGDDLYVGMTAASQGAAWDQSVAVLVDGAGDDVYRADGLSQGAAAQQALAALIDRGGIDRYLARGDSVQGHSGGNEYHFDEPPPTGGVLSFSILLDLLDGSTTASGAPQCDGFSSGRGPGRPMKTGDSLDRPDGPTIRRHGLFFAEPAGAPASSTRPPTRP